MRLILLVRDLGEKKHVRKVYLQNFKSYFKMEKHEKNEVQGQLKKIKPFVFDDEMKYGEEAKAWLLGMRKYFRLYDYSCNMKANMEIHNLNGKASIW